MQKIINIRDLPEEEVKLVEDFIEFLKARKERKKEKKEKEDFTFASWDLEVKGKLRREEIYE
jgi:hypothetical protein